LSAKFNVLKNNGTQNNHIGLPLTLLNLKSEHDVAVVEMGTNHFGEIGYLAKIAQPNMGIITNIAAAHLEHFGDLKGVFREKSALLKYLKHPHIALLNADDKFFIKQIARRGSLPLIFGFGLKERSDFSASGIKIGAGRIAFSANQHRFSLRSRGYYNVYNALAAVAAGRIFGLQYKEIAARISSFEFLPGRLKLIELGGIQFIDDTYNSNPASLRQALEALESIKVRGRKILVMGDMLELGSQEEAFHVEAGKKIARACDAFIAVGDLAGLAAKAAKKCGLDLNNIFRCASSRQAKDILFKRMAPGPQDIVLVKGSRAMNMEEVFKL
jgi:UDP-N-acetylmuramoyl-tripeptide--D-alanyl-D-alanine ligase